MIKEFSYGVIPLYVTKEGTYEMLLVQRNEGTRGFPKGHREVGEEALQTAEREFLEETGLAVVQRYGDRIFEEEYVFVRKGECIDKYVGYFLGRVATQQVTLQADELKYCERTPLADIQEEKLFPETRKIIHQVKAFLLTKQIT